MGLMETWEGSRKWQENRITLIFHPLSKSHPQHMLLWLLPAWTLDRLHCATCMMDDTQKHHLVSAAEPLTLPHITFVWLNSTRRAY